jgi:hypothetical protein
MNIIKQCPLLILLNLSIMQYYLNVSIQVLTYKNMYVRLCGHLVRDIFDFFYIRIVSDKNEITKHFLECIQVGNVSFAMFKE